MASLLEFIVSQRWLFAIFLLPISFFYDIYWYLRSKWVLYQGSAPRKHQERVDFVQKQVLDWQKFGDGRKMCTARPTWMSISQQKITYKVFKSVLKFSELMIRSNLNCEVWILIFFSHWKIKFQPISAPFSLVQIKVHSPNLPKYLPIFVISTIKTF